MKHEHSLRLRLILIACGCVSAMGCHHDAQLPGNNVIATRSPSGEIAAVVGADPQTVSVDFATDNGDAATGLVVSGLETLPEGWTSASDGLSCDQVAAGTDCQLTLTYGPESVESDTLTLTYKYVDSRGGAKTGEMSIPYVSTSDNSVLGTAAPVGSINLVAGESESVAVTFQTDDGNDASEFTVTTDLTSLPDGWSSASPSFECESVATGAGCALSLTFAPSAQVSGTLTLDYEYMSNSGESKTGSVEIPYAARGVHVYVGHLTGVLHYCSIESDSSLSSCAQTSGLNGATGIAFKDEFAYVADYYNNVVSRCEVGVDGSLSSCASAGGTFSGPFVVTIDGDNLYAGNGQGSQPLTHCKILQDGSLSACTDLVVGVIEGLAVSDQGYLYISQPHQDRVAVCGRTPDGSVQSCLAMGGLFTGPEDLVISNGYAFVTNTTSNTVSTCLVSSVNGTFSSCISSTVSSGPMGIALHEGKAYVSTRNGVIDVCDVSSLGALSNCVASTGGAALGLLVQIAVH